MTSMDITRISPDITVGGAILPAAWYESLRSMRVNREVCLVGRAVFRFTDFGYTFAKSQLFRLGDSVAVSIRGDSAAVFDGVVVGAAIEQSQGAEPEFVVTVDDAAYALALRSQIKPYLQMTIADIIRTMASAAGLSASIDVAANDVLEHILQRSSDLDFIDMLSRRVGAVWWVEGTTLNVKAAGAVNGTVTLDGERDLQDFSVRASGLRPPDMTVKGWDPDNKQDLVGNVTATANTTATSDFVTAFAKDSNKKLNGITAKHNVTTASNPQLKNEAEQIAGSLLSTWQSAGTVARGTIVPGIAGIKPSTKIVVSNVGPLDGNYIISSVEHVFNRNGLVTKFVAGPVRPSGLVDSLGNSTVDGGLTMANLTTAVVSDGTDPQKQGRVKLKYVGVGENVQSDWARVLTLGGGGSRGAVFQPEVGDEVLVGFERGDTRRPVVLGGLYSKQNKFAADDAIDDGGKIAYRRVTSRLGHVLELGDGTGPDKQHFLFKLATAKNSMRLGADEMTIELEQGKPFTLKVGSAKIAIDNSGNITIQGMKITLKADTDVEINGVNVKAKASAQLALEGTATAELKGGAQLTMQASGQAAVKGAIVMIN